MYIRILNTVRVKYIRGVGDSMLNLILSDGISCFKHVWWHIAIDEGVGMKEAGKSSV